MEPTARPYISPPRIKAPGLSLAIIIIAAILGILLLVVASTGSVTAGSIGGLLLAFASGLSIRAMIRGIAADIELRLMDIQLGNGQVFMPKATAPLSDANRKQFEG